MGQALGLDACCAGRGFPRYAADDPPDAAGRTALHRAAADGDVGACAMLLDCPADLAFRYA